MHRNDLLHGTKRRILDLLVREKLSVDDIANRLGVTRAAVRQHLVTLDALDLVNRTKGEARVGRPTYLYCLSDLGRRAYPKRYDLLLAELVEILFQRRGREETLEYVTEAGRRLAARIERGLTPTDSDTRWETLLEALEEAFQWEADAEPSGEGRRRIIVHRCPFMDVASEHPAVCGAFFTALLEEMTGAAVIHAPIGDGQRCCALNISA